MTQHALLPRDSARNRVAREDMVTFINACFACSGQAEFYSDSRGQAVSIEFLHDYILGNYRRLYARTLAAGINHFNQARIILNLLATGRDCPSEDRGEEGALVRASLASLPPQRALKALSTLREWGVNNRRTRAVAREYLEQRADPFFSVKYRSSMRRIAGHAHLTLAGELGPFLFNDWRSRRFQTPLYESFRKAQHSADAVYELPFSIAEGLAVRHRIPRDEFLRRIAPRMTAAEKLRAQESAQRAGVELAIDLSRVGLTKLASYVLSLSIEERKARRSELDAALDEAARRALVRTRVSLGRVAAVLDASYSSAGSSDKRRRPLAVALASSRLLRTAAAEYRAFWSPRHDEELLLRPRGTTDLATPVLSALEWNPDLLVLVTDGFENDPPQGAAEVLRVFRQRLDPSRKVTVVHLNPVFDAENYSPRTITASVPTVGLRDAEDLFTLLGFARFADGSAPLSELEGYLAQRVARFLEGYVSNRAAPDALPQRSL